MRAVIWKEPHKVAVEEVEDVSMTEPTDAILRLTTAGICGSDLHMYEGRTPVQPGEVFGHENLGVIEEVGSGVRTVEAGDRVVLPFNVSCGFCFNCVRGYTNACLVTNPTSHGGGFGYSGLGPHRGGQAEFLRVPYADFNCLKLPGTPGDDLEDDFLLLADVFPTGWHATEQAHVEAGEPVAIFGAGPVGLMAALSARLKGASEIYVVDAVRSRLDKAREIEGTVPIDLGDGDPVEQIIEHRRPFSQQVWNLRPGSGDKMPGVMSGIDAVGYEAWNDEHVGEEQHPSQVLDHLVELVNPTGHISLIGVYFPADPGGVSEEAKRGRFGFDLGACWNKGIGVEMGQAPVKAYNQQLRDLIVAGRCKPSFFVSHHLPLEGAPRPTRSSTSAPTATSRSSSGRSRRPSHQRGVPVGRSSGSRPGRRAAPAGAGGPGYSAPAAEPAEATFAALAPLGLVLALASLVERLRCGVVHDVLGRVEYPGDVLVRLVGLDLDRRLDERAVVPAGIRQPALVAGAVVGAPPGRLRGKIEDTETRHLARRVGPALEVLALLAHGHGDLSRPTRPSAAR